MISRAAVAVLKQLTAEGVSPWLSDSGRPGAEPALARQLAEGQGFLGLFASTGTSPESMRSFCDALRPAYDASGGQDGRVSVGLSHRIIHDAEALIAAARAVERDVGRPNLLARIPATRAGLSALTGCLAQGISVDATFILSAEHLGKVLDAYLTGVEQALSRGIRLDRTAFVASLPVGLLDREVNARLSRLPSASAGRLRDRAAVATAQLVYRVREERLDSDWWRVLRTAGASPPRLAWTTAEPWHIDALVGWNTIQAVSVSTLETAAQGGDLHGDTLLNAHPDGRRTLEALEQRGIDMAEVAHALERACLPRPQGALLDP